MGYFRWPDRLWRHLEQYEAHTLAAKMGPDRDVVMDAALACAAIYICSVTPRPVQRLGVLGVCPFIWILVLAL